MLEDTLEVMYTFFLTVYVGELNSLGRRLAICYNCIESNLSSLSQGSALNITWVGDFGKDTGAL